MSILSLNFWFGYHYLPALYLAIIAALFLALAIVFHILSRRRSVYSGLERRVFTLAVYNAVIALIFSFLNYEEVRLLSSLFWYSLWVLEIVIWGATIGRRLAPARASRAQQEKERNFRKYLP